MPLMKIRVKRLKSHKKLQLMVAMAVAGKNSLSPSLYVRMVMTVDSNTMLHTHVLLPP
eukprot:c11817_g1_i2 orf=3-173(-)